MIKHGINSIAYLAADDQKELVDFAATALADGWAMHCRIAQGLQKTGMDLVTLMKYFASTGRHEEDQIFRLEHLTSY